jgi:hypothetical protein
VRCWGRVLLQPRLKTRIVEEMRTGQLPRRVHFLPAYGTVVGVVLKIVGRRERIILLHVVQHPKVVSVLLELPLNLVREITQLHDDDKARHRQEDVRPKQHVKVMAKVDEEGGKVKPNSV